VGRGGWGGKGMGGWEGEGEVGRGGGGGKENGGGEETGNFEKIMKNHVKSVKHIMYMLKILGACFFWGF
jgi:hypothetical protein